VVVLVVVVVVVGEEEVMMRNWNRVLLFMVAMSGPLQHHNQKPQTIRKNLTYSDFNLIVGFFQLPVN